VHTIRDSSVVDRLRLESFNINSKLYMQQVKTSRGTFVRVLCVLCIALVCAMGVVQATHSHAEDSTTSHHSCSICATAHAGFSAQTSSSAPVLATAVLANSVSELAPIFRPLTTPFIRPPPVF
jgi:hypothetical protein